MLAEERPTLLGAAKVVKNHKKSGASPDGKGKKGRHEAKGKGKGQKGKGHEDKGKGKGRLVWKAKESVPSDPLESVHVPILPGKDDKEASPVVLEKVDEEADLLNHVLQETGIVHRPLEDDVTLVEDDDDLDPDTGLPMLRSPTINFTMSCGDSDIGDQADEDINDAYCFDMEGISALVTGDANQIDRAALTATIREEYANAFHERVFEQEEDIPDLTGATLEQETNEEDIDQGFISGRMTPVQEEEGAEADLIMTPPQAGNMTPGRMTPDGAPAACMTAEALNARLEEAVATRKSMSGRRSSVLRRESLLRREAVEKAVQEEKRKSLAKQVVADGTEEMVFKDAKERRRYELSVEKAGDVLEVAGIDDPEEAKTKLKIVQEAMADALEQHTESIKEAVKATIQSQDVPQERPSDVLDSSLSVQDRIQRAVGEAYRQKRLRDEAVARLVNAHSSVSRLPGRGQGPVWVPPGSESNYDSGNSWGWNTWGNQCQWEQAWTNGAGQYAHQW